MRVWVCWVNSPGPPGREVLLTTSQFEPAARQAPPTGAESLTEEHALLGRVQTPKKDSAARTHTKSTRRRIKRGLFSAEKHAARIDEGNTRVIFKSNIYNII